MTGVRFDLIDKHIAWAEAEEAKGEMSAWNQQRWVTNDAPCGTAYCIAGHVAVEAGWKPVPYNGTFRKGGNTAFADAIGVEVLGLEGYTVYDDDPDEPGYPDLFLPLNGIVDLKRIRDEYAEEEGFPLKYSA